MAKLPRIFQRIFGTNADPTQIGVFGSLAAGSPATGLNLTTLQSLSNFTDGWSSAVIGGNSPAIEDVNALDFLTFSQLAYIFQAGIPEYEANTIYYTGSFCTSNGILYYSITDTNSGNTPASSPSQWIPYDTTPSGIIVPFGGVAAPSGYAICDGSTESRSGKASLFNALTVQTTGNTASGSAIVTNLGTTTGMSAGMPISGTNIQAGTTILSVDSGTQIHLSSTATGNGTAQPVVVAPWGVGDGSTTFNRPDLRGRTLIGSGTGSGLTARALGVLLGEETHLLTTGELPAHSHGITDPGHFHSPSNGGSFHATIDTGDNTGGGANGTQVPNTNTKTTGITINNSGGGGAHNVMQPSAPALYIVKY